MNMQQIIRRDVPTETNILADERHVIFPTLDSHASHLKEEFPNRSQNSETFIENGHH